MKNAFRKMDILAATVLTGLVSTVVLGQTSIGGPSLLKKVCPAGSRVVDGVEYTWPAYLCEPDATCTDEVVRNSETDEIIGVNGTCSVVL